MSIQPHSGLAEQWVTKFPDEAAHFADIQRRLDGAIAESWALVEGMDSQYRDTKQYMVSNRHEIDPNEIFRSEQDLMQIEQSGNFALQTHSRLERLAKAPYFGRIDFGADGQLPEALYIGPFAFAQKAQLYILDWRAPASGMFYDCEPGPAAYQAPMGRVEGELTRKRQFSFKEGRLEYVLESGQNIQDDVLAAELSRTADDRMKTIIATIAREQNRMIRDEQASVLVIQGTAGSGKTSIALHRVAYLMYRQRDRLTAANVLIISPNKVFGDYISTVLPELGEEPVYQMGFYDLAEIQLDGVIALQKPRDPLEGGDEAWATRAAFKVSLDFLRQLEAYWQHAEQTCFVPEEYRVGELSVSPQWLAERYRAYAKYPVSKRLDEIAADILDRFQTDNVRGGPLPGLRSIRKALTAMMQVRDTLELYRAFFAWLGRPELFVMPDRDTLEWEDAYPYLYLHSMLNEIKENKRIRHLVIDEMQDYTPVQYGVIRRLFPCDKTILGDFGQMLYGHYSHSLEDFSAIFPGAVIERLNTSYRSTVEIIQFAKAILPQADIVPIDRHGCPPQLIGCADAQQELDTLMGLVEAFQQGEYQTMGIITKTAQQAEALYRSLTGVEGVNLITEESTAFTGGISVLSVHMAKGLEFDEVIVPGADSAQYHTAGDRHLLYICCTRAMHKLSVVYTGQPSPLLPAR